MSDITVVTEPRKIEKTPNGDVLVFTEDSNYSDAFGFEWENYSRTYTDSTLGENVSQSRVELNLGFPLEFLKDKTVLELGCGQGRFSEQLAKHAKQLVMADMSYAVYHNVALGKPNVLAIRADINNLPEFSDKFDVVFCRGVIQHTPDPVQTLQSLFGPVKEGGLVIFDVYKKGHGRWRNFKYFWRPLVKKKWKTEEDFNNMLNRRGEGLYKWHHRIHGFLNKMGILSRPFKKTPFYLSFNWEKQYPQVTKEQRLDLFKNELIDMLYSPYDNPMSPEEVVAALAAVGQRPYSFDINRNHFRCKKQKDMNPKKYVLSRNGVVEKRNKGIGE